MEFTNNIYNYLEDEYGKRLMGYPFLDNDEKSSYIEGIIDKRAFQIHFYEKSINIKIEVCFGKMDLLKELYRYLVSYLDAYVIINNNLIDWSHNNGQISIVLNDNLINSKEKVYLKR